MTVTIALSSLLLVLSRVSCFHPLTPLRLGSKSSSNFDRRPLSKMTMHLSEVAVELSPYPSNNTPLEKPDLGQDVVVSPTQKVRKGSAPEFAIAGDSTVETPAQVAITASHFGLMLLNLATAAAATPVNSFFDLFPVLATIALSVIAGDFGTGVFHWATDNYGSIKTPIFGSVCAAFQGHHITPWTITFRSFSNNVYKICYGTVPALLLVAVLPQEPLVKIFFTLFITWWMISQELHKFSHMRSTPKGIKFFQDMGVILSKKEHGLHHTAPFEGHYCILTGVCNKFLDDSKFFRHMENIVYKLTGEHMQKYKLHSTLVANMRRPELLTVNKQETSRTRG